VSQKSWACTMLASMKADEPMQQTAEELYTALLPGLPEPCACALTRETKDRTRTTNPKRAPSAYRFPCFLILSSLALLRSILAKELVARRFPICSVLNLKHGSAAVTPTVLPALSAVLSRSVNVVRLVSDQSSSGIETVRVARKAV
jgi:hypothetical protein